MKTFILLILTLPLFGGFICNKVNRTYYVYAVPFVQKKCGSSSYSHSEKYELIEFCGTNVSNVRDIKQQLVVTLMNKYSITETNVYVQTSTFPAIVVLEYQKKRAADCEVTLYAEGFGKTEAEAEKNAIAKKISQGGNAPFKKVKSIACH